MPERIQLRRTKGWRKPEGAIVVARPSKWGNPYKVLRPNLRPAGWCVLRPEDFWKGPIYEADSQQEAAALAVQLFRRYLEVRNSHEHDELVAALRGHDLACWCPLEDAEGNRVPCHADVLLEVANA